MSEPPPSKPRLRPVEALGYQEAGQPRVTIHDPSGLAVASLNVSLPAVMVLSLMNGERSLEQIRADFLGATGQALAARTLVELVAHLHAARLLEGPAFEQHYAVLLRAYREAPSRTMNNTERLGLGNGSLPADLAALLDSPPPGGPDDRIVGVIAPHLDYDRGRPCYRPAYAALTGREDLERFVILGTNHFGRAPGAVATAQSFETPLGVTAVDRAFLEALERRTGHSLREYELDHRREHSVELQVLLLQHLFGAENFEIVPLLCPDPCAGDPSELRQLGQAIAEVIARDCRPTVVVAGADLSHIGGFFGDEAALSDALLGDVGRRDQAVLQHLAANDATAFQEAVADLDNPTRICSAGCIYTLMSVFPQSEVEVLHYHQAVNQEAQCTVTCAAAVFRAP